jgi:hypothetical protein
MSTQATSKHPWGTTTWILIAVFSIVWWLVASDIALSKFILVMALGLSAFMVGCLVGFLFTSYGEEVGTVGKVRDWVIGGLAGLTIAKAESIKSLLMTFASGSQPNDFALIARQRSFMCLSVSFSCSFRGNLFSMCYSRKGGYREDRSREPGRQV